MKMADINSKNELIEILETRMREKDFSNYKIHKITGLSQSSISRYFNGESDMSLTAFVKISNALSLKLYLVPEEYRTNEIESTFNTD